MDATPTRKDCLLRRNAITCEQTSLGMLPTERVFFFGGGTYFGTSLMRQKILTKGTAYKIVLANVDDDND